MQHVLATTTVLDVIIAIAVPANTLLLVILAGIRTRDQHHLRRVGEDAAASARIAKEAGAIIRSQPGTRNPLAPDETPRDHTTDSHDA